ncbi:hypothetical protein [Curtobacterium sp. MCBA15_012]|uniref:hypothetical protein n=1 Tax=Curtobacterium sp. MCBA15_012 TaxID=1898738 RepID=UPI0008DD693F|nr:hypothetical protein [Curtobacterium sp. MCBA15_012]WIB00801.1 hypothetical protein QOL15_03650 [Curtobacterium sp. MCBA15_012]
MSSTPLFDSIADRASRRGPVSSTGTAQADAAAEVTGRSNTGPTGTPRDDADRAVPVVSSVTSVTAPTSPFAAPVPPQQSALVPAALVTAIDAIPAQARAALGNEHVVGAEQLGLVEAVADALTRVVVDAVVHELERITRDGVVRA